MMIKVVECFSICLIAHFVYNKWIKYISLPQNSRHIIYS